MKWHRWKMIRHTLRQDQNNDCNRAMTWPPKGQRRKGRLKNTWGHTAVKERKEVGWKSWNEVQTITADQERWKCSVKALCATRHEEDKKQVRMRGRRLGIYCMLSYALPTLLHCMHGSIQEDIALVLYIAGSNQPSCPYLFALALPDIRAHSPRSVLLEHYNF